MMKYSLLLSIGVFMVIALVPSASAQSPVSQEQCARIDSSEFSLLEKCYTALTLHTKDISYCNYIKTPGGTSRCRGTILLMRPDIWSIFGPTMVLVYIGLLFVLTSIFTPERLAYLYGCVMAAFVFAVYIVLLYAPFAWSKALLEYYEYVIYPIKQTIIFAPNWFHSYPHIVQIGFGSLLVYGQIIGNLLIKKQKQYIIAGCLIVLVLCLTFYSAQFFTYTYMALAFIKSLFTN